MARDTEIGVSWWIPDPPKEEVRLAVQRLATLAGVIHIAVMPDVHLAPAVCNGVVIGTSGHIYPQAVGGDIGCGMAALPFDANAQDFSGDEGRMAAVLRALRTVVPTRRQRAEWVVDALPGELTSDDLSSPKLDSLRRGNARMQFGTLGSGNHFLEFQADEEGRLWMMVHSGSRGIGPAIRDWHLDRCMEDSGHPYVLANTEAGNAYLSDMTWARRYASHSRELMAQRTAELLRELYGFSADWAGYFQCDHNHVQREVHNREPVWVHRKGAMEAASGRRGIIPGTMGTVSFHVEGRGNLKALCSSSHGAGRDKSRTEARLSISRRRLLRELGSVQFDQRIVDKLRDEAPSAYKDIERVMRAQRDLVKITRRLRPLLVYKGG